MSVKDREKLAAFVAKTRPPGNLLLADQRLALDGLSELMPTVEGYEAEPTMVGGVKGEWVRGKGVRRSDAALLYLHGGGFCVGSPKSHRHLVALLSSQSGLPVFSATYRLAPEHRFPAALDDAMAAYQGLLDKGLSANKLAIAGDSAGGGLTISTLVMLRDHQLPMPACALVFCPWVDLSQGGQSHRSRAARDKVSTAVDQMAQAYLDGIDPKTPLASPVYASLKGLPPLLIQVGRQEALFGDAASLRQRAEEDGVEVSFESWGGMTHVWQFFHPLLAEGHDAVARAGNFLKRQLM